MDAKILVVDDELSIQKLLFRYLVNAGYECHTCGSVKEAQKVLAVKSFDLLISDLKMPGKSGLELIQHAKEQYPHIGRVIITGFGSPEIASEIMEVGVYGYVIKPISKNTVLITIENALRHLYLDQHMQASKRELKKKVSHRTEKLTAIMNNLNAGVVMVDLDMNIVELNQKMFEWFPDVSPGKTTPGCSVCRNLPTKGVCDDCQMATTLNTGITSDFVKRITIGNIEKDFRIVTSPITESSGQVYAGIALYEDVTEKLILERDLHQGQKLEAIGQLAAGIAHEINTPVQYIGDNLSFLKDSFDDISKVLKTYERFWQELTKGGTITKEMNKELSDCIDDADIEYLWEEIPETMSQSLDGVRRVDKIVRAMKEFSHPGGDEKIPTNINTILENAITVCRNEWKYVAELTTDFTSDLPLAPCFSSQISQVFLNIIVNGAHAIGTFTEDGKKGMGKISISSSYAEDRIIIRISDTGGGIPKEIQDRVFEPFFTTKARGQGTGQGLAIAHSVVVDKHQGKLFLETENGRGTTFVVEIPA